MQTIAFYTLFTLFFGTTKTFTHSVLLHRSSNGLKCQYTNTSFFSLVTVLNALNLQTFENVDSHPKCHGLNNYSKSKLNIEDEEEKKLNENKISTKMGNYVNIYQPAANFKWLFAFHRSITTMYNELYCVVKTRDFLCFVSECFIHSRFAIVWKANKCYYFYVSSIQNFTISTKHIKTASYTITYFIHGNLQGVLFNWIRTELEMVLNLEPFAVRL